MVPGRVHRAEGNANSANDTAGRLLPSSGSIRSTTDGIRPAVTLRRFRPEMATLPLPREPRPVLMRSSDREPWPHVRAAEDRSAPFTTRARAERRRRRMRWLLAAVVLLVAMGVAAGLAAWLVMRGHG